MKEGKKVRVMVAGGFDPLHIGHLAHFQMAKKLGDWLIVSVNPDSDMIRKKGYCFMPLEERREIIKELRCVDEVLTTIDNDGTQAETLKLVKPDIFAKGGDRTPGNMPQNEVDACEEIGCKIVYGVGPKLTSSSELVRRIPTKETMQEVKKVWGREVWIVNCPEYCGKLLYLDKGAESSYHKHKEKKETFYALEGQAALTIESKDYMLNPYSRPKTVKPGQLHSFLGITKATILEIASHHDDNDVYRVNESKGAQSGVGE